MNEPIKTAAARFIGKLGSGRLFVVVAVLLTFCIAALTLITAEKVTVEAMAVFGTLSTLATSIGKDYFNRERRIERIDD